MLINLFSFIISKLKAPWLNNSSNKSDAMLTFAAIGLFVTCLSLILGIMENVTIGEVSLSFEQPDTTLVLGILSATLGAYVLRRNKKDGLEFEEKKLNINPPSESEEK